MVRTESTMLDLGTQAPGFELPDQNPTTDQGTVSFQDVRGEHGTLVMFLCNHCPYVKEINPVLGPVTEQYLDQGIGVVAISSNDVENYPDDGPKHMAEQARSFGFPFPYLYDEDQSVAQAYHAACTPDFFLFDGEDRLVYRGQFDGARPGNDVDPTGEDLTAAVEALLDGRTVPVDEQVPSMGCNIKRKPGNEPVYFG
jgi:peroxiredoxin